MSFIELVKKLMELMDTKPEEHWHVWPRILRLLGLANTIPGSRGY
jgi:hypothetical protein